MSDHFQCGAAVNGLKNLEKYSKDADFLTCTAGASAQGKVPSVFESSLVILCGSCQAWGTPACLELLHISKLRTARERHLSKRKAPSCGRDEPLL
ncbi:uncharacterized protein M8220_001052 isoform 2-T4 [Acridotheres tristis]